MFENVSVSLSSAFRRLYDFRNSLIVCYRIRFDARSVPEDSEYRKSTNCGFSDAKELLEKPLRCDR